MKVARNALMVYHFIYWLYLFAMHHFFTNTSKERCIWQEIETPLAIALGNIANFESEISERYCRCFCDAWSL